MASVWDFQAFTEGGGCLNLLVKGAGWGGYERSIFFLLIGVSVTSHYSTVRLLLAFNSDFFSLFFWGGGEWSPISINSFLLGFDCFEWFFDSIWEFFFFFTFHGSIPQLLLMSLRKSSSLWLCEINLRSFFLWIKWFLRCF